MSVIEYDSSMTQLSVLLQFSRVFIEGVEHLGSEPLTTAAYQGLP